MPKVFQSQLDPKRPVANYLTWFVEATPFDRTGFSDLKLRDGRRGTEVDYYFWAIRDFMWRPGERESSQRPLRRRAGASQGVENGKSGASPCRYLLRSNKGKIPTSGKKVRAKASSAVGKKGQNMMADPSSFYRNKTSISAPDRFSEAPFQKLDTHLHISLASWSRQA